MMISEKKVIRNAFLISAIITLIYIVPHFFSGNYIRERLEGTWRATCIQEEIIFTGNTYIRGQESGEFRVWSNMIYFGANCYGYPIRITARYLVINGIYYLRRENFLVE